MTIQEFIDALSDYSLFIFIGFVLVPVLSYGYGRLIAKDQGGESPHKYVYSVLIYLSSLPGVFACVLTAYALFIMRSSLLTVNVVVYMAPIASMVATIILIRKNVDLDDVPGFDRIMGLFIVMGISFFIALMIHKLVIVAFIGSSIFTVLILFVGLFVALKYGAKLIAGKGKGKDKLDVRDL